MAEVISSIIPSLSEFYLSIILNLPGWAQTFLNLFFISLMVVIYSVFIWKFYMWVAKKNILELNLSKFNKSEHAVISKIIGGLIYFLEYLIILPFVVFLWFGVFTIFLILLTDTLEVNTILVIGVVIVAAIRMTAYYKENLSKELAKLIPLTLLVVAISQGLFNFPKFLEQIQIIPSFISDIWVYLIFIIVLEFILRLLDIIFLAFDLYDEEEVKEREV
ncbi:hypothetical protein J4411_03490 [Candidatus Pacearchaeota archaeon]|nr:hypothetical protein [Candidatus Pacearchaeota archaeon]